MGKAEFGTPKYVANQIKKKGLQPLKWYCQVCSKQCRDSNGYKCHIASPSHIRNAEKAGPTDIQINENSKKFEHEFIYLLRISHGTKLIGSNRFYTEYIRDRDHTHMHSTRWRSLAEFVRYLARKGICDVYGSGENTLIAWRDTMAAAQEKASSDDSSTTRRPGDGALKKQLEAAKAELDKSGSESKSSVKENCGIITPTPNIDDTRTDQAIHTSTAKDPEGSPHIQQQGPGVSFKIKSKRRPTTNALQNS